MFDFTGCRGSRHRSINKARHDSCGRLTSDEGVTPCQLLHRSRRARLPTAGAICSRHCDATRTCCHGKVSMASRNIWTHSCCKPITRFFYLSLARRLRRQFHHDDFSRVSKSMVLTF